MEDLLSPLVKKIVYGNSDYVPTDEESKAVIRQLSEYSKSILASRIGNNLENDEDQIVNVVKKTLVRKGKIADALKFTELIRKWSPQNGRHSVLHVLLGLSDELESGNVVPTSVTKSFQTLAVEPSERKNLEGDAQLRKEQDSNNGSQNVLSGRMDQNDSRKPTEQAFSDEARESSLNEKNTPMVDSRLAFSLAKVIRPVIDADEVPEAELLRDVVYAAQGIDGSHVRFDLIKDHHVIDMSENVRSPVRTMVQKLCEMGWLYKRVMAYVNEREQTNNLGHVAQSFLSSVQRELMDYYKLVSILDSQVVAAQEGRESVMSLHRLYIWCQVPLEKLKFLAIVCESVGDARGGAVVSKLNKLRNHGDPLMRECVDCALKDACVPLFAQIRKWICEGELDDAYGESFVEMDPKVPLERLWREKYRLREEMVPSVISRELSERILMVGKSINFVRYCCNDSKWVMDNSVAATTKALTSGDFATQLPEAVKQADAAVSQRLMELIFDKYELRKHFMAIKSYLLLGQGEFIQGLMELLGNTLSQPAESIFKHNLAGVLEAAIRASNAQFDDERILDRLDLRLQEPSPGECGWDIFSLDYHVEPPLSTVFTPHAMKTYLRVFNFLWRLKRVEFSLNSTWRRHMNTEHQLTEYLRDILPVLHSSHLLRNQLLHFVCNLQYYIMFEVLECSWQSFDEKLGKATNMDELLTAHEAYLKEITRELLLSPESAGLLLKLTAFFDLAIKFRNTQELLYSAAEEQIEGIVDREKLIKERTEAGEWGTAEDDQFEPALVSRRIRAIALEFQTQLEAISAEYATVYKEFSLGSNAEKGVNMRFLSFRLDFNEFYTNSSVNS